MIHAEAPKFGAWPRYDDSGVVRLIPYGNLGIVSDLRHEITWPGGDDVATWTLDAPPVLSNPAVVEGTRVAIYQAGGVVWRGYLLTPERGYPWKMSATGLAAAGAWKRAQTGTLVTPQDDRVNPANSIDLAQQHDDAAWLWRRRPGSTDATRNIVDDQVDSTSLTLLEALERTDRPTYWTVSSDGLVSWQPPPVSPTHVLHARELPARNAENLATEVFIRYNEIYGGTVIPWLQRVAPPEYDQRGPRRQDSLDLRNEPAMTAAQAEARATAYLDDLRRAGAYTWSGPLTAAPGDLVTPGGTAVDLSTVRPPMRVRVVPPADDVASLAHAGQLDVLVERYVYDWDTGVASLTPSGTRPSRLVDLLGAAAAAR